MSAEKIVARVPSLSDARTRYDLTTGRDGALACSCPAFYSWRKRGQKCWHLRVYEAARRAIDRCWEKHAETPDGCVCETCLLALLAAMAGAVKRRYVEKSVVKEKAREKTRRRKEKKRCRTSIRS